MCCALDFLPSLLIYKKCKRKTVHAKDTFHIFAQKDELNSVSLGLGSVRFVLLMCQECYSSIARREEFKCFHHREMVSVQGDGYTGCPGLIITPCVTEHAKTHTYAQLLHIN